KKLVTVTVLGCATFAYANVNAVVSILPQTTFVKAIGGDKVNVSLMVKPGNSPHTYEPKPTQMKDISKADVYFSIGVEFENNWLPKFSNQNNKMKIINISTGIEKMAMIKHNDHEEEDHEKHAEDHEEKHHEKHAEDHHNYAAFDPHVWTSPDNVKIIAKNILKSLIKIDKKNEEYYKKNHEVFIESVNATDTKIKSILKDLSNTKFMVFHPSWGYFAKQYNLIQVPIEIEGKSPKPKEIIKLIKSAKKQNIQAILTAPEFSEKVAKQIAKELNIPIVKISALNPKWSKNLINLAKTISNR
ncbi:MAG: zinc ABC transporter substrate-binding protein, partial [Campylobacterota bacterium]|nr:zinc ABC transporter substrate-binding protein [Campylobacterota bacterium]